MVGSMRLAGIASAAILAMSGLHAAAQTIRTAVVDAKPFPGDAYPARTTAFPGGVTGLANVTYAVVPGYRPLSLDLYLPPKTIGPGPHPLILYVHGGGWTSGHTRQAGAFSDFPKVLASLAAEGFVVASVEYRLSGEARFPAQIQDVRSAIRFLKTQAGRYGIAPLQVGIWGASAGGQLAALAALSCGSVFGDAAETGSECVQGAVIWYGVFDFSAMMGNPKSAQNALLGCGGATPCAPNLVRAASPVSYIGPQRPPFLLIHGSADHTVPVTQTTAAFAAMKTGGMTVDEIILPDVDHSFIGATPQATRAASLRALNATFDFFHTLFARPRK